jgi:hypothetical protein
MSLVLPTVGVNAALDADFAELARLEAAVEAQKRVIHDRLAAVVGSGGIFLPRPGSPVAYVPVKGQLRAFKVTYGDGGGGGDGTIPPTPAPGGGIA